MAVLDTLTLTGNGTTFVKTTNTPAFEPNRYTAFVYGTFDGATVQIVLSPDGIIEIQNVKNGSIVSFTAAQAENIDINSSDSNPAYIGFKVSSAGASTDITVRLYDNSPG